MKFIKSFLAVALAAVLICLSGCTITVDGDNVNVQTQYSVTLHLNGGELSGMVDDTYTFNYRYGNSTELPKPSKDGYDFLGWFDNESLTGAAVGIIGSTDSGNKIFWAKWEKTDTENPNQPENPDKPGQEEPDKPNPDNPNQPEQPEIKTYTVTLNLNGGILSGTLSTYTEGTEVLLPVPTRSGYNFGGWFETENFDGTVVTKILKTDSGNKIFWAKWSEINTESIRITKFGGYGEGAYIEFEKVAGINAYKVAYKKSDSVSSYTEIDTELIRVTNNAVRADILGLSAGDYTIKVTAGSSSVERSVAVEAQDRSGYAHFTKKDVGAYNADGSLKDNTQVFYFTEDNKNASIKIGSKTYTGLVGVLRNIKSIANSKPVVIRIIGRIAAATWNELSYDTFKGSDGHITPDVLIANTPGKNSAKLSKQNYTQAELISGGFNTLNETKYSELLGLDSKMKYDSSKKEFDSCWNNCPISEASNVTLEGVGTDAEFFQWGITWSKAKSVEVRNLKFSDYTEDACSFEGSTSVTDVSEFTAQNIWVHNCTFNIGKNYWDVCNEQDKHEGDGATDIKGCSYVTISYNNYNNNHKTGLIGGSDSQKTACVTFHHNYYNRCSSRLPLARQANMHMYNNYYNRSSGTNMSIRAGGYAFIEYCYFNNANNPITTQDGDSKIGAVKVFNCTFVGKNVDTSKNNVHIVTNRTANVTNDNVFNKTFDTDASFFYYDASAKASDVTNLITDVSAIPNEIPKLAGVLK